jgi:uncharacterized phage protein (TIGR01671 family)
MREIKFRAWDLDAADRMYSWEEIKRHFNEHLEHERVVVMQYTGLKDKNGKEIFEGDVLKSNASYDRVFWNEDKWCFEVMKRHKDKGGWIAGFISSGLKIAAEYNEIVGNIYENPELINQ